MEPHDATVWYLEWAAPVPGPDTPRASVHRCLAGARRRIAEVLADRGVDPASVREDKRPPRGMWIGHADAIVYLLNEVEFAD